MRCGILVDRDVPSQVACLRNAKEMCIRESKPTSILEQALALLSLQLPGGPEAEAAAPAAEEADGEAAGDDALARDEALAGAEDHDENE
jgi:hypothetical protein